MDLDAYLQRIGYTGSTGPTAQTLHDLHVAHLMTVPFENLSIPRHEPIILDEDRLFDKIVCQRRGGFCYELNGLFCALLRELGFDATRLSASVTHAAGGFGQEFDHMTLRVSLDRPWLADVGFGDSFREPLLLDPNVEQPQGEWTYRLVETDGYLILQQRGGDETWADQYRFTGQPRQLDDYAAMCHFHQTSPQSSFTQHTVCTLPTPAGRITLSDRRLIRTLHGQREERELTEDEWRAILREEFGIVLE
jgi:N-hydroxyarylamine O-acetyltransferase